MHRQPARLIATGVIALMAASNTHAANITVNAAPAAEIVVAPQSPPTELFAAQELQYHVRLISSALLPIMSAQTTQANTKIFVGREAAQAYTNDLAFLGDSDGFAVRSPDNGKTIYVFGAVPKGTLNGVYAFIENNTDLIWARPDWQLGTIYSLQPSLSAKWFNGREKPKSTLRGWGFTVSSPVYDQLWQSRNRANYLGYINDQIILMGAKYVPAGGGHGLKLFMDPKDYFDKHPEFFPLRDGKRTPGGQLCFSADAMLPIYIANLRKTLDNRPDSNGVNISITDGWGLCDCDKCLAPIRLPDGQILKSDDPAFRSAQFFIFLNKVAKEIAKSHPRVDILTYAYIFAVVPPRIPIEPNIRVMYCPFVKNDKFTLFDPERNRQWREYALAWGQLSPKVFLREYYGCAADFPRPIETVVQKDLQFCLQNGIHEFNSELPVDKSGHSSRPDAVWDVSAMTMWVITRMWWDPDLDPAELRNYYLERTYREAAPAMKAYYALIRDAWYSDSFPSVYSDSSSAMAKHYIIEKGIEDQCRKNLQEAQALAVHPISRSLVDRQLKAFEGWIERARNDKTPKLNVPVTQKDVSSDFDAADWEKGGKIGEFAICNAQGTPAAIPTEAVLLHDRKNLYVRIACSAPDMKTLQGSPKRSDGSEAFPRGDHLELFVANPITGTYWHFAFDVGNEAVYDAKGYDPKWTADWKRSIRRSDTRWESITTIPLDAVECNVTENNKLRFLAYRSKYFTDGTKDPKSGKDVVKREQSSWGGGFVHEVSGFGELTLEQN